MAATAAAAVAAKAVAMAGWDAGEAVARTEAPHGVDEKISAKQKIALWRCVVAT